MIDLQTEKHPLEPFLPPKAKILMLGSFPPKKERWSMDFFYPNWINDMWRIVSHIFYGEKEFFIAEDEAGIRQKKFDKEKIASFCYKAGIALYDTACEVRRLKDNASDKFLEIVTPTDLPALLSMIPECQAIITTGQKATDVIVETFGCQEPPVGDSTMLEIAGDEPRQLRFWRMPSSSRAYPLPLEKKAEHYREMFSAEGLI